MTDGQVWDLLTAAAAFDRRKAGKVDKEAWLAALGDLQFEDCRAAVIAHYTETTEWLMPAHVRQRVLEMRAARLREAEIPEPPAELLDDPPAYRAALRAAAVAIADGRDPQLAMKAVARARCPELGPAS